MRTGSRQSWPRVSRVCCLLLVRSRHDVSVVHCFNESDYVEAFPCRNSASLDLKLAQHVLPRQERHAHTEHHDYPVGVPCCEASEQGCCRLHCWLQSASRREDVMNTMLLKCKKEVHAAFDRHMPYFLAFGSCCQDDRVHCCDLLSQSKECQGGCGSEGALLLHFTLLGMQGTLR